MADILMTGFPGFLGSALLPLALARRPGTGAICLVQQHFMDQAQARLDELTTAHPDIEGRVRLVVGDITQDGLGVADNDLPGITEVFHLAAIYDLAVRKEAAYRVNVGGTKNVLHLCVRLPNLERLQYVSTCYVSGSHDGPYTEDDLDTGQSFRNHYEQTKFEAEELVRAAMAEGLPATIYRPGIVVGDSRTGETQKYDGPYFLAKFLMKQRKYAVVPRLADPESVRINLAPRDFVIGGIDELSAMEVSVGRTYALTDPDAPTAKELVDTFCRLLGKDPVWVRVPVRLSQAVVGLPGVERLIGFPQELLAYFAHATVYDTTNATTDLATVGVTCPKFADYAPRMIDFVKAHPDVSSAAMT